MGIEERICEGSRLDTRYVIEKVYLSRNTFEGEHTRNWQAPPHSRAQRVSRPRQDSHPQRISRPRRTTPARSGPRFRTTPGRRRPTVLPDTKFETGVYVQEAKRDGPTAVVVTGQHGFERSAQDAAMRLVSLTPEKGKLVVIPHADVTAIHGHSYSGDLGNLNRHRPTGEEPKSELARELWSGIENCDPDVAFDPHDSKGIYGSDLADGVGQAIFPTPEDVDAASDVIDGLNEHYIGPSKYSDEYLFTQGNEQSGSNPLLSHTFGGDLEIPGWLIETTRYEPSLTDRVTWCFAATIGCLAYHGLEFDF